MASIREFGKTCWSEVYNRIIGAVVFLDDCSAECLHWDGGLFNLLSGGAVAVKSLSPFESCESEHKKAVFISQTTTTQLKTINEIIRNSDFTHCILISCVSLDIVYLEQNDGKDVTNVISSGKAPTEATKQLEGMLLDWIGKKQCSVEVVHIPIFTISPTNVIFLTPPYSKVYPQFDGEIIPEVGATDLYSLSSEERSSVRRLASGLNSMLGAMNLKEDVYYMGQFSAIIAGVLENSPVCINRRKICSSPTSLIIVDRTLDLCGPTSHSMESFLDKVMAVLPRLPGHSNDVAVNMSPLCVADAVTSQDDVLSPGCMFHANDDSCVQTFDYMINKSQKEVMFDLYNKLSKIEVKTSPDPVKLMKITSSRLNKIIVASKGNYDIIEKHIGILQVATGVVQTLNSPKCVLQELQMTLERVVLQSLAASGDSTSILSRISHLIKNRKDRGMSLENLLALLVHLYSLKGTEVSFTQHHEEELQEVLSVAIFEDNKTLFTRDESIVTPEECEAISRKAISRLRDVALIRKILHKYNSVIKPSESGTGHEYKGVLQQLVEDAVDSTRPDLTDLGHRNEGIKDLLRSGLNILTSKKKNAKHPLDNQTMILFVVGGITAEECKRLHRAVITSGVDNVLLLGGTRLLSPGDAVRDLLRL